MSDFGEFVDLLRASARIECGAADRRRLLDAALGLADWAGLPAAAEAHGLAPLLYFHLTEAGASIPIDARQQLFAASVRHRDANRARFQALGAILDAFDSARVPVVVLKGAALAWLLYPTPGLRPMSDIDLLVAPQDAARAQSLLSALGFAAPASPTSRRLVSHHHLPLAMKQLEGHVIQVELHTDALSRDTAGSLSQGGLTEPPQRFFLNGHEACALGHADMLYHLCRHTAERAPLLRLIWVADIVSYASRYRNAIDWTDLRRRYPFVLNALSLLHLVTPLPETLLDHVVPARDVGMRGVGVACRPLAEILTRGRSLGTIGRDLFDPSDWWLRLHYGVSPDASLAWLRWVRHPARVTYWFARRVGAYTRWSARRVRPERSKA